MKVQIKSKNHKEFNIYLPLFMLKVLLSLVRSDEIDRFSPLIRLVLKDVKRYVRENGHFEFMEIESEGNRVKIIV